MYLRVERLTFRTFLPALLLGAVAASMSGCAGAQQQRIGKTYMATGDYDRAVKAAKEAVATDPGNSEYLDLLSDAQTAAADFHFAQARKSLDDHHASQAMQELDKALEYMPAHPGANTLRVTADKSVRQCRDLSQKAHEAIGREEWEQAALLAHEACEADRGDSPAQELFNHARSALVARHLAQAQLALDAGDSQACLAACTKAKKWDESNPYLAQLERKAKEIPARTEAAASPASPPNPQTRPAEIATAIVKAPTPEPVAPASESAAANTPSQTAQPVAAAPKSEEPAPVARAQDDAAPASDAPARQQLRPKDRDGARVPPRLARAAQEPPAKAAGSNERLIEAQPIAPAPARNQSSKDQSRNAPKPAAPNLITVDPNPSAQTKPAADPLPGAKISVKPGKPGERAKITPISLARGLATRPAEQRSAEPRPLPGRIADAQTPTDAPRPDLVAEPMPPMPAPKRSAAATPKPEPQHLFRGALSRDDHRYKKQITVVDGISIKLRDTDADPLDADFEIVAGKFNAKPDDVPPGGKVEIRGTSGRPYVMTVIWIDHDQDTVHFSLDRVD